MIYFKKIGKNLEKLDQQKLHMVNMQGMDKMRTKLMENIHKEKKHKCLVGITN